MLANIYHRTKGALDALHTKTFHKDHISRTGRSLLPLAAGKAADWRRSIRDKRYKLIQDLLSPKAAPTKAADGCPAYKISRGEDFKDAAVRAAYDTLDAGLPEELYDLESDPAELRNPVADPEMKTVLERLRAELLGWRKRTCDPLLNPTELAALTKTHEELRRQDRELYAQIKAGKKLPKKGRRRGVFQGSYRIPGLPR